MRVALTMAVVAVALGVATGTRVLLFDGVFVLVGVAMSWATLRVSIIANGAPTDGYPFGREGLTPFMVMVQGLTMLAALLYAALDALIIIFDGGRDVAAGVVAGYSVVSVIIAVLFERWIRRVRPTSDVIEAEATQWGSGGVQSQVTAIGIGVALVLSAFSADAALLYVDPVLLLISAAMVVPTGVRLVRHGLNELLRGRPDAEVALEIEDVIGRVCSEFGLSDPVIRSTKLGTKLHVEVVCLTADASMTIGDEDRVRRAVVEALAGRPYELWVTTEITADPELVA